MVIQSCGFLGDKTLIDQRYFAKRQRSGHRNEKSRYFCNGLIFNVWELRGSNPRPSACKADALNQLS
jgi:hypothetical protein